LHLAKRCVFIQLFVFLPTPGGGSFDGEVLAGDEPTISFGTQ
jgi:hypothetical protein